MVKKKHKNIDELRIEIIVRAWKDPEFKARLLKSPRVAFKEMGAELPDEIEVRVVEDKPKTMTFVLPRAVANVNELSDRDLQKLAGGACHARAGAETGNQMQRTARFGGEECEAYIRSRGLG